MQSGQAVIRNGESTSWVLRGTVSAPAGYGAAHRSTKYVSKWTHWFFITINSMILYFKRIIHIDDFPLNGTYILVSQAGAVGCSPPQCRLTTEDIFLDATIIRRTNPNHRCLCMYVSPTLLGRPARYRTSAVDTLYCQ